MKWKGKESIKTKDRRLQKWWSRSRAERSKNLGTRKKCNKKKEKTLDLAPSRILEIFEKANLQSKLRPGSKERGRQWVDQGLTNECPGTYLPCSPPYLILYRLQAKNGFLHFQIVEIREEYLMICENYMKFTFQCPQQRFWNAAAPISLLPIETCAQQGRVE